MIYAGIAILSFITGSLIMWATANGGKQPATLFIKGLYKTPKNVALCTIFIAAQFLVYKNNGLQMETLIYFILLCIMFAIALEDFQTMYISNKLIAALLIGGIILLPFNKEVNLISALVAFVILGGLVCVVSKLSREALGLGDAKIIACLGIWIGVLNLVTTIFYASLLSALVGIYFILRDPANKKKAIPFAPFILTGLLVNLFF